MSNTQEINYNHLKDFALNRLQMALFGVAPIERLQSEIKEELIRASEDMTAGISMAMKLSDAVFDSITDHPHRLYMHHYQTVNRYLDQAALLLGREIENMGGKYVAVPASLYLRKRGTRESHLSHRTVAYWAGLGWIGRNNLLVNPHYGAKIRLVTILTNLPLKFDKPIAFGCEDCYECVKACPAGALGEKPENYNYQLCYELLTKFIGKHQVGHHICGVCIKVCQPPRK